MRQLVKRAKSLRQDHVKLNMQQELEWIQQQPEFEGIANLRMQREEIHAFVVANLKVCRPGDHQLEI